MKQNNYFKLILYVQIIFALAYFLLDFFLEKYFSNPEVVFSRNIMFKVFFSFMTISIPLLYLVKKIPLIKTHLTSFKKGLFLFSLPIRLAFLINLITLIVYLLSTGIQHNLVLDYHSIVKFSVYLLVITYFYIVIYLFFEDKINNQLNL